MQFIKANPRSIETESNDCSVRATSLALNKPYNEVHKAFAKHGRMAGKGVTIIMLLAVLKELTKDTVKIVSSELIRRESVARFIKANPKGRYVICKRGHAFAIIDGVAHDAHENGCGSRSIVKFAYKVGD